MCSDPAEVLSIPAQTILDQGQTMSVTCTVGANPLVGVNDLITWTRPGYEFDSRSTVAAGDEPGQSTLSISDVQRTDSGIFECRASNGIGQESVGKTKLVVRC